MPPPQASDPTALYSKKLLILVSEPGCFYERLALTPLIQDTDSGIIAGNRFSGALRGMSNQPTNFLMFIEGNRFSEVTGWSIVDNDFSSISDCGAILTEETARFVVGPDQACAIIDRGSGNFILE